MAAELGWKRSSYTEEANCVECAIDGLVVRIRDSKDRDGQRLEVPWLGWQAFLALARS
ncbi:DUF397 domain-containing protein [Lentzea sp. BCCO 10_0061]|uniref:DUF397 domain-containing protein n=1 Tax=Lentzea sokolovensis TaxID=3095429 RepID=A0ABU4V1G6_9PSEU|nr:DUF397 domain-containing protein [Lentzea sp. BCCO 10_0061]MDX8144858.1 DUF397 domain-containing protein [Lentzea sp. BCCO 10_0061]